MCPTDLKELQGEYFALEKAVDSKSTQKESRIRVFDLDGKEYCLPTAQCQTWFVSQSRENWLTMTQMTNTFLP